MPWMGTEPVRFSRRAFVSGLGGLAVLGSTDLSAAGLLRETVPGAPLFASARRDGDGRFTIAVVDDAGQELARIALPGRGHGIAVSPDRRRIMAFARRPGTFALLIDLYEQSEPQVLTSIAGRHFYGHGCFSADGQLVYAVENDYEAARGVVGIYDVSGQTALRVGEFETGGVGPHDILLMKGGTILVVANGGVQTHPEKGRRKLNIDSMRPSIVFLDLKRGDVLSTHALPDNLHQVSLRHMALDGHGKVWIGGQFEGSENLTPPLVMHLTRDTDPIVTQMPPDLTGGLQNYIGSVVASADGEIIATSAPRGGQVLFWKARDGALLGVQSVPDGCGIAPVDQSGFLISDGSGGLRYLEEPDAVADVLARPAGVAWDNHMSALSPRL